MATPLRGDVLLTPSRHFREYWFDIEGHISPFSGWGE